METSDRQETRAPRGRRGGFNRGRGGGGSGRGRGGDRGRHRRVGEASEGMPCAMRRVHQQLHSELL